MADYAKYGTALRELEQDEAAPKRFQDDTVRDERGRRRFHGAFTGGFSAGYFNSVGTKEGWTPQDFVSSRSQRAGKSNVQRPEDFMDSEDLGEMGIAPQRVRLREGVRTQEKAQESQVLYSRTAGIGSQRELLQAPLVRLLATDRESVGARILRSMGWRPGRGVGPAVTLKATYGPQLPESISGNTEIGPDEVTDEVLQSLTASAREHVWGLGYSPVERLDLFSDKIDRERVTASTATVEGRRVRIRGTAFGVGAFEEDDEDIYAKDDMTQYNFEEYDHREHNRKNLLGRQELPMIESKRRQTKGGVLDGFVIAKDSQSSGGLPEATKTRIEIPQDWTPKAASMAAAARVLGTDLGERPQPVKEISREDKVALLSDKGEKSVFSLISAEDRARIEAAKKAIEDRRLGLSQSKPPAEKSEVCVKPPSLQEEATDEVSPEDGSHLQGEEDPTAKRSLSKVDLGSLQPFSSNPMKQDRFDRFIRFAELGRKEMLASIQPPSMSQWEALLEKKEFESALLLVRPQLGLSNRFATKTAKEGTDESKLPTGLSDSKDIAANQSFQAVERAAKPQGPPIRPLKEFGKDTHSQVEWHPHAVLCKRFNVPNPYLGDDTVGIPASALCPPTPSSAGEATAESSKATDQPSTSSSGSSRQKLASEPAKPAAVSTLGSFAVKRFDDLIDEEEAKSPPPVDFFKFIFSDDEDEDEAVDEPEAGSAGPSHPSDTRDSAKLAESSASAADPDDSKSGATSSAKKSSGLFADLDLTLLNKRPPPKPIKPLPDTKALDEEAELPPMGPVPPPVIAIERVMFVPKHARGGRPERPEKRKESKKSKKERKSKKAKKDSKKAKKHKKDKHSSSGEKRSRKRRRRSSGDRHRASSTSSSESADSDPSGSSGDAEEDLDQRLREKIRKLKS